VVSCRTSFPVSPVVRLGWLSAALLLLAEPLAAQWGRRSRALAVPASREDSVALHRAALDSQAVRFFEAWRLAWVRTEERRRDSARRTGFAATWLETRRAPWLHCHGPFDTNDSRGPAREIQRAREAAIGSLGTAFNVCPSWLLDPDDASVPPPAERDARLGARDRDTIRAARRALTHALAAATQQYPEEPAFIGQWVRHLVEADRRDSARRVAATCASERWWCEALQAWTLFHDGRHADAERRFAKARAGMPVDVRCQWEDVRELLPDLEESPPAMTCAAVLAFAERLFWLADPLWMDSTNERRLLHDVRTMDLTLAMHLPLDEHARWSDEYRGDAVARMVLRYGWPTLRRWGGTREDDAHDNWMVRTRSTVQRPYTTHEYSPGRVHLVPSWFAMERPYSAQPSDWDLAPPADDPDVWWWPHEHVELARPLAPLAEGQLGFLRRADSAVLFVAHDHPAGAALVPTTVAHVLSTGPVHRQLAAQHDGRPDSVLTFTGAVAGTPTMLGVEVREEDADGRDWRARHGITPPAPLHTLALDTAVGVALSDLFLLRATPDSIAREASDSLLAHQLLGTLAITQPRHPAITVLWERYDVVPRDSVAYTLTLERVDTRSGWARLADAARLRRSARTFVQIRWTERADAAATPLLEAPVRTFRHTVQVNVQPLQEGVYDLSVEVQDVQGARARSARRVRLVP
jgi:hypothetical protein